MVTDPVNQHDADGTQDVVDAREHVREAIDQQEVEVDLALVESANLIAICLAVALVLAVVGGVVALFLAEALKGAT